MQAIKEKAANVAAAAKSGLKKTKAAVQEKVDKMTAHTPAEKEMATERKDERIHQAELNKRDSQMHNAEAKHNTQATGVPHSYSNTGEPGHTNGAHQMSALPGHGTGHPAGAVVGGVTDSHPVGTPPGPAA